MTTPHRTRPGAPPHPPRTAPAAAGGAPRRLLAPAAVLASVAAAFAVVGAVDPNVPGHYPVCPLLRLTGVLCPGCGGLRGVHALVHGDLAAALHDNALAVLGYAAFAVGWSVWAWDAARGRPPRLRPRPGHVWALGALMAVFTVLRNLPAGAALAP